MIDRHFEECERLLRGSALAAVVTSSRAHTSPETGYWRALVAFVDGSRLAVFEHVDVATGTPVVTKYRYHHMTAEDELVFRYDNAPHHPEIGTYPHHKHTGHGVAGTHQTTDAEVLREAEGLVLRQLLGP